MRLSRPIVDHLHVGLYRMICIILILFTVLCLSSCVRVVNGPADELRMYSWQTECDNGNTASLAFENQNAALLIQNTDFTLTLSGLCIVTDDSMTVCDVDSGMNYTFGYTLYGDRVELTCNGGKLTLEKVKQSTEQ